MAKILVVDDTRNIRKMVQLTLEKAGHSVEVAEDGAQGLERFGDGSNWDLTLVDQQMPRVEGRELIVEARARDPLARLVMMTAFATADLAAEVLSSGATDFLRKPFSTDTLRDTVETALATPRAAPPVGGETPELIEPGQAGFSLPRTSYRFNGFSFWPVESAATPPQGFDFGHQFQVRHPDGHLSACFVGITPHIREQMQRETVDDIAPDDPFWEDLCGQAVMNFLWEKTGAPPEILPVYEVPKAARGSNHPIPWGPFAVG